MDVKQERSESEKLIRRLYEITTHHFEGLDTQVKQLLKLGCERFNLDIGILSNIKDKNYTIVQVACSDDVALEPGDTFEFAQTYCEITLRSNGPVGFEHVQVSEIREHPAYEMFKLESYIGIPVNVNGEIYGTLNFSSPAPHKGKFRDVDIDALQLMAQWIESELSKNRITEQLRKANKQLEVLSKTDSLTCLLNRRAFDEMLDNQIHLANRGSQTLSLIMIDLDYFKQINDQFGHLEGDKVLTTIANLLDESCRSSDFAARYGGEEFIVGLPNTDELGAETFAESFRHLVEKFNWKNKNVTASFGVSTYSTSNNKNLSSDDTYRKLVNEADSALYISKEKGRNQITHFDSMTRT